MSTQDENLHTTMPDTGILFAAWAPGAEEAPLGMQNILLPLLDRPMLQRVVERLVRAGCKTLHVVLGEHSESADDFLGDGTRWGCRITCHQPTAEEDFVSVMERIGVRREDEYIVAAASRLPLAEDDWPPEWAGGPSGRIDVWSHEGTPHWAGWGIFAGDWLLARSIDTSFTSFETAALFAPNMGRRHTQPPLSSNGTVDLLNSMRRLLAADVPGLDRPGRGCNVHASARIIPPVHIGRHVEIGADAVVGPNVVLGDGAFIDRGVEICDSIVLPDCYVGEKVELADVVAQGKWLADAPSDTPVKVQDRHPLSWLRTAVAGGTTSVRGEKLFAAALRGVLAPLQGLARAVEGAAAPRAASIRPASGIAGARSIRAS